MKKTYENVQILFILIVLEKMLLSLAKILLNRAFSKSSLLNRTFTVEKLPMFKKLFILGFLAIKNL